MDTIKVIGICGSLRSGSYNLKLLRIAENFAGEAGASVEELDLRELALPLYDQDMEDAGAPENVLRLKNSIAGCDVILFAAPEYNYSIASPLKNAIDWASRGGNSFKGKTAAIFGASTGAYGTLRGQFQLRLCLTAVDLLLLPQPQVLVSHAAQAFNEDGTLKDEKNVERLKALVTNTLMLARELKHAVTVP